MKITNYNYVGLQDINEKLDLRSIDTKKTFIQVFSGLIQKNEIDELCQIIKSKKEDVKFIGTTTAGEIFNGEIGEGSITVSIMEFENTSFENKYFNNENNFDLGVDIATSLFQDDTKVTILFIEGLLNNGNDVLDGISSVNNTIPVSGGMAGDNGAFAKTFVFDNTGVYENGAVAVSLNSKCLKVLTNYQLNWQPIGNFMTVTKAEKNRLYEIDGIPASDIYRKYLGDSIGDNLPHSAIEFPLLKIENDGLEVCRTFVHKFDEDGSLLTIGNLEVGDKVRLAFGNVDLIINGANTDIQNYAYFQPEAIFTYSCTARVTFLQSDVVRELKPLNDIAPIAGFFTYGEIYHHDNKNSLLNISLTILGLSEDTSNKKIATKKENFVEDKNFITNKHFMVLDALSHLSNTVIDELDEQKALFQNLFDAAPDAIVLFNGEGKFVDTNEAAISVFGVDSREELLSLRPDQLSPEFQQNGRTSFECMNENIHVAMEQGRNRFEWLHIRPLSNEAFYADVVLAPFIFKGAPLIYAIVRDISESKAAAEKIANNELFIRTLIDSQEQMVITTNGKTLLSANKTFLDFYAIDTVKDFKETYGSDCVCETFNIDAPEGYLQIKMGRESWIDYVISRSFGHTHKAKISMGNIDFVFSVTAAKLPGKDGLKSAVFTNITEMENAKQEVEKINKHTRESIEYASLIQSALIPNNNSFQNYFQDYFSIWQPKDIVGGDIYLFEELRDKDECLLMVIDCTGHGVPGAFVTMLVKAIERQIIAKINNDLAIDVSPAWILSYFNRKMKILLKQENMDSVSNAGFDGGVIYFNKKEKILKFAGAETPLFYIEEEELKIIKGSRHSVGYKKSDPNFEFKDHIVEVKEGMQFYCATDGYLDQNGGEKGFPFSKKRFTKLIQEHMNEPFAGKKEILLNTLEKYQGDEERNDDVTLVGFII